MIRKKGLAGIVLAACALLAGCGSIPDLNAEQEEMISEYSVSLLLKYDSENHTRLVDVENYVQAYNTAVKMHDDAEAQYYAEKALEEEQRREEAKAQEELNASYSESTRDVNITSDHYGKGSDGTGGAFVVDARSFESVLGISDFSLNYAGFDIVKTYPEEGGEAFFALDADPGMDLLIIYFNVTNNSSDTKTLDMVEKAPVFKLSVNDGRFLSNYLTLLEDDLSGYIGDFEAGESKRLLLVSQVNEGTVVDSLGMRISCGNDSITKSLK